MEDQAGNVNEKLENKKKKRGKDNGHLNASNICDDVNQQDKEVETVQRVSDGDPVGKVGKKKRKRKINKCVLDEGASWEDNTQLTESGKKDMESQTREHIEESDDGHKKIFIDELGKKKKKRKKEKDIDAPSATRKGILAKKNYSMRFDSTMDEEQDKNIGIVNAKGKIDKEKSIKNGFQDSKSPKSSKKVRFSTNVEVFPSFEIVPNWNDKNKDSLVRGKRFSIEEDEIVRQAVLNYIDENCLGDEGLTMVLNARSHRKVFHCWKEIGACLPYRPYRSVYYRGQVIFRRSKDRKWTKEECERVLEFYNKYGPKWKVLADELGKHHWHVRMTWCRIKLAKLKKGRWNQEEYQDLFKLVNKDLLVRVSEEKKSKYGMLRDNIGWTAISETMETRISADCCHKWYDQLSSPMVAEGKWADADDYRLINALYQLDASCLEDVNWDNLIDHRSGDVCRKRWKQMVLHVGQHATKSFAEQVEVLATRSIYLPFLVRDFIFSILFRKKGSAMAGGGNGKSKASNLTRVRKRVEADSSPSSASNASSNSLKRAKNGSAFTKCGECNKDVAVALISFHDCSLDAKIKMNLEAQVTEKQAEVKKKPSEKKKPKSSEPKAKKEKKDKNPNKPKRPPTAFFIFMDEFRKSFKEANPDCKSVAQVAKEGGEKWKSLTDEEKKPYVDKAAELKAEYVKSMESVNGDDDGNNDNAENDDDKIEEDQDGPSEKEAKEENLDDEDA